MPSKSPYFVQVEISLVRFVLFLSFTVVLKAIHFKPHYSKIY